ncbi:DEAD/DEAH box helicase [Methylomonas sp. CM2]|uniref:DEAD/DEAH box helicase n=1 Tax=Methylomonas sp. CM2 TaxID=3417647 RepID=UPI003CEBBE86
MIDFSVAQNAPVVEEAFQSQIIDSMSQHLLNSSLPALLRAPTGSGKTLMMGRVLERLCQQDSYLWLWFVPFVNLVQQTEEAITANCRHLKPYLMATERQYDHKNGDVLIANAQQVASKSQQRKIFNPADEFTPAIFALIERARVNGLKIGVVIDEAHIGVSSETEFGKFCQQLAPDKLILATATPKDQKLNHFLGYSGFTAFETFIVSRDQAVAARLNKRYVVAYVYRVGELWKSLADIRKSVLRQAWQRHLAIKQLLQSHNIATVPLLLVQVENGKDTTTEAFKYLVEQCKVPHSAIGEHSADNPDPVLMANIANDIHKEVLIFKESAGTGFDAPRAFTLASMKTVVDSDFATQFVGRIMRVDRQIRSAMLQQELPDDLQTAFLYLANADTQEGFQRALDLQKIQSDLQGSPEKLNAHETSSGRIVITNRPIQQLPISPNLPLPLLDKENFPNPQPALTNPSTTPYPIKQESLFANDDDDYDLADVSLADAKPKFKLEASLSSEAEILGGYQEINVAVYSLKSNLPCFQRALMSEKRPALDKLDVIARTVAEKLTYSADQFKTALSAARDKISATEVSTELTSHNKLDEKDVRLALNRDQLAKDAKRILKSLPQLEEADHKILLGILEKRLQSDVRQWLELGNDAVTDTEVKEACRDAAHVLIILLQQELIERINQEIANQVISYTAEPLPDAMIFPADIALNQSAKNIYGHYPPSKENMAEVEQVLLIDERRFLVDRVYLLPNQSVYSVGYFDYTYALNNEELMFAKALDVADFVLWWHRNPDRKPYSTKIVRADKANYFYPDFVLCVKYYSDAEAKIRLVETKENVKDAMNKAARPSASYGKVIFLTRNNQKLHIVNDDGSLGVTVSENLAELREQLRETGY